MLNRLSMLTTAIVMISGMMANYACADPIISTGMMLADGTTYTVTGDAATEAGDGDGLDFRTTTNGGGSFAINFSAPVDLTFFASEINQGNNFDGEIDGANITLTGDTGTWVYTPGLTSDSLDLTNGTLTPGGQNVVGFGNDVDGNPTATIGNGRIFTAGPGVATSGAPISNGDWGSFSIQGIQTFSYDFSNATNFEGFRIDAVSSVPEPSSLSLLGLGCLVGLARRRRS